MVQLPPPTLRVVAPAPAEPAPRHPAALGELASLLYGEASLPCPAPSELLAAIGRLAEGRRPKELVPLGQDPAELALLRRGEHLLVSLYPLQEESAPWVLDRPVPLREAAEACARALRAEAAGRGETARQVARRMAERVLSAPPRPEPWRWPAPRLVEATAGEARHPVAFEARARLQPLPAHPGDGALRSDLHALLFPGRLQAWLRGQHVVLGDGPLLPRLEALLAVVEAGLEAEREGRALNVRRAVLGEQVRLSRSRDGEVRFGLGPAGDRVVLVGLRSVADVAAPVASLLAAVLRGVVRAERAQSRNLRLRALRRRLRTLRERLEAERRARTVRNDDPERLRWSQPGEERRREDGHGAVLGAVRGRLRYRERWRLELDGLDAERTWLCGELLVVTTVGHQVAVDRDRGEVRWAREAAAWTAVRGRLLLRQDPGGVLELCSTEDGEPHAQVPLAQPVAQAWSARLGGLPPVLVVREGDGALDGIDPRTGEVRWRRPRVGAAGGAHLHGRALLVARPGGTVEALDVLDGEAVWRCPVPGAVDGAPRVVGETVVVPLREGGEGLLAGIDLWRGELRWTRRVGPGRIEVVATDGAAFYAALRGPEEELLLAVEGAGGALRWMAPHPVPAAEALPVDGQLLLVSPGGEVVALGAAEGSERWRRRLAEHADEMPRCLQPVLRGGALFVPLGGVRLLRPADGTPLGHFEVDAVADRLRVDERGALYVAEESGLLVGAGPGPVLGLVR